MTEDFLRYYDLETYIFNDVHRRFQEAGRLDAFDFFSIVIWKAQRAESKVAKRLLNRDSSLERAVELLCADLTAAQSAGDRLQVLLDRWELLLPMASAVLSVFWPDEFTVYDYRAAEQLVELDLGDFKNLGNLTSKTLIPKYFEYRDAVKKAGKGATLRESDRLLWGRSTASDLRTKISNNFENAQTET